MRLALLLLALSTAIPAQACPAGATRPIPSLNELPHELLNVLGRFDKPRPRIADIGEKFNSSDVIFADSPPQRRLVAAVAADNCVELKVEFGGIAYRKDTLEFENNGQGWTLTKGSYDHPLVMKAPAEVPKP